MDATVSDRRILVVANASAETDEVHDAIRSRTGTARHPEVLLVAPTDGDAGRREAEFRLAYSIERLRRAGVDAEGVVTEGDPLHAIDETLKLFEADEIVIAEGREVADRARARYEREVVEIG